MFVFVHDTMAILHSLVIGSLSCIICECDGANAHLIFILYNNKFIASGASLLQNLWPICRSYVQI